jgi:hypothetical protein
MLPAMPRSSCDLPASCTRSPSRKVPNPTRLVDFPLTCMGISRAARRSFNCQGGRHATLHSQLPNCQPLAPPAEVRLPGKGLRPLVSPGPFFPCRTCGSRAVPIGRFSRRLAGRDGRLRVPSMKPLVSSPVSFFPLSFHWLSLWAHPVPWQAADVFCRRIGADLPFFRRCPRPPQGAGSCRRVSDWRLRLWDAGSLKRSPATTFYPCRPEGRNT